MNNYPKEAGIYKLTCINNGKIYIGKSVNIYHRISCHKSCAKKSEGRCYFENALIRHGWDAFSIEILETFTNFDKLQDNPFLLEKEEYYINLFESYNSDKGYNLCKFSTDRTGIKHSEETKIKMRKPRSQATKEKNRQARLGKKHSKETKEKISKSNLGRVFTDDHKQKLRESSPTRIFSVESKLKMSRANLGKKRSEESKEKMRMAKLGKTRSDETKEKIRLSKLEKLNK